MLSTAFATKFYCITIRNQSIFTIFRNAYPIMLLLLFTKIIESNLERRLIKGGKGGSHRSSRRGSRLYGRKFDPFDIDDDEFDELFGEEGDDDWDD